MNWAVLIFIALFISGLVLWGCGVGGGFILLITMNGVSESDANPILIVFALIVIGLSMVFSMLFSWLFVKIRGAEISFWKIFGVSAGANAAWMLLMGLIVVIMNIIN